MDNKCCTDLGTVGMRVVTSQRIIDDVEMGTAEVNVRDCTQPQKISNWPNFPNKDM